MSTAAAQAPALVPTATAPLDAGVERRVSSQTWRAFIAWTALFWGGTGVLGALFYVGTIDFVTSTKVSLYGTSVWLNGWLIPLLMPGNKSRPRSVVFHECLVLWMVSYTMTNLLWEIPWVLASPFVFTDLHTLDDVVARTAWMRESVSHMYWWVLASFASVDLRTVNHDGTFYALELFAFVNVASTAYFYRLNQRRSKMRYLVPVLGGGEPIAATVIFSFSEVFNGYANMPGGVADTLLALVWTQYQYIVFPLVFSVIGLRLLREDWLSSRVAPD